MCFMVRIRLTQRRRDAAVFGGTAQVLEPPEASRKAPLFMKFHVFHGSDSFNAEAQRRKGFWGTAQVLEPEASRKASTFHEVSCVSWFDCLTQRRRDAEVGKFIVHYALVLIVLAWPKAFGNHREHRDAKVFGARPRFLEPPEASRSFTFHEVHMFHVGFV